MVRSQTLNDVDQVVASLQESKPHLTPRVLRDLSLRPDERMLNMWVRKLEQQQVHSDRRFTIMVLGKYNAGKSTLLNALLDLPADRMLPVWHQPTTARPLRLTYRRDGDPEARWILHDGRTVDLSWDTALVAGAQNRANGAASTVTSLSDAGIDDVVEIHLFLTHPLLYQADIVDMPGTGTAEYQTHTVISRDYLAHAEMVLWVIGFNEPDQVGRDDINLALEHRVPVTVVFNAWGTLDAELDAEMAIDQDSFERDVQRHFPEVFVNPGVAIYRVYARKCREAQQRHLTMAPEFGWHAVYGYLFDNYVTRFQDHASQRQISVRFQVAHLVQQILEVLETERAAWEGHLIQQDSAAQALRDDQRRMAMLEQRIEADVAKVADIYAGQILDHMSDRVEKFILDTMTPTNFEIWKKILSTKQREQEQLEQFLEKRLRNEYLQFNQPNNWLDQQLKGYLHKSQLVLEAQWSRFLDKLALQPRKMAQQPVRLNLPLHDLAQTAIDTVFAAVQGAVAGLASLLTIVSIPVLQIVGLVVLVVGTPFLNHHLHTQRERAINATRDEMSIQRPGVAMDLVNTVMQGPHAHVKAEFTRQMSQRVTAQNTRSDALEQGLRTLDSLIRVLERVAYPAAGGEE